MSIKSRYAKLEESFCQEAKRDGAPYLRYRIPEEPVDFILVAMEPSVGKDKRPDELPGSVSNGVNFARSRLDFILHYCVQKYLCKGGKTYFLTDVAKGRMTVKKAEEGRSARYERWRPLLIEEINLLAKKDRKTKVIAIGEKAGHQLRRIAEELDAEYMGWVIHYSGQWPGTRAMAAEADPGGYSRFKIRTTGKKGVIRSAEEVLDVLSMPPVDRLERIGKLEKKNLSESERKLAFTYRRDFKLARRGKSLRD